jgi:tRNA(Ile)-lysidine synthase
MVRVTEAGAPAGFLQQIAAAVCALPAGRYLLAVSGGRDSMVLLDAFGRWRDDAVGVATFDHATGRAAQKAALLVELEGDRRRMRVVKGVNAGDGSAKRTEAEWRAARWRFLEATARDLSATVVTAHTLDDQLETVVMRMLRDPRNTSARGLAAMYARSAVARPLLDVRRADVALYADSNEVRYLDDPSNLDRAHLRNRVRLDLLPALERANPGFAAGMISVARRAADWREGIERIVDTLGVQLLPPLVMPADPLVTLDPEQLALLWPAICARAGIALDWRGLERLVGFTASARSGRRIPLSGGATVSRTESTFVVHAKHYI